MYVTANATLLFFASRYRWLRFLCVSRLRDLGKGFGEVGKGSRNKSFAAGVGGISGAFAWNAFLRRGTGLRQLWFQLLFDVVISPVFVRAAFLHFLLHPSSLVFARANTAAKVRLRLGNWYVWRFGWDVWTRRGYHPNWIECSYFEDLAVWELLTDSCASWVVPCLTATGCISIICFKRKHKCLRWFYFGTLICTFNLLKQIKSFNKSVYPEL